MLNVYAAAAHPTAGTVLHLANTEEVPKGVTAVVAVVIMFGMLCGGVFMLLQSSFGPKLGYLITGTAFWGCWFVLSLLWFTGVPGLPLPGNIPDIPTSTPRFLGPQGSESSWLVIDTPAEQAKFPVDEAEFVEVEEGDLTDQNLTAEITAAQTAANEVIAPAYAKELGVEESSLIPDQTFTITKTEIIRDNRELARARVTTGPVAVTGTDTEEEKALIAKIKPKTFVLGLEHGTLSKPTYVAMGVTFVLLLIHALLLGAVRAAPRAPARRHPRARDSLRLACRDLVLNPQEGRLWIEAQDRDLGAGRGGRAAGLAGRLAVDDADQAVAVVGHRGQAGQPALPTVRPVPEPPPLEVPAGDPDRQLVAHAAPPRDHAPRPAPAPPRRSSARAMAA